MRNLFSDHTRLSIDDDGLSVSRPIPRPLAVDPWVASSLLQKAIRRGDAVLAERAAATLRRFRGKGIWRRFMVIAFEDVGVASVNALIETATVCSDPVWREGVGGDEGALRQIVRLLANVPKDRSPDHLIGIALCHPAFEDARGQVGAMSLARRIDHVADTSKPLPERAIAAWYASGIECGDERRVGPGDLDGLMHTFRHLGAPADLVDATRIAAIRTREPIVIMTPLLSLAATAAGDPHVIEGVLPPVKMIGDIPSYALDKHTAIGKAAIHRLARENHAVREVLAAHVPEYRANAVACMTAFHVDAAPVSRRFEWTGSAELERLGVEADMAKVGVPSDGVAPLLAVVRDNLDCLNAIRAELFGRGGKPRA
jgi:hypothetical protein